MMVFLLPRREIVRACLFVILSLWTCMAHANPELVAAIENVRNTCGGISAELSDLKKMAGINTAVTAAGTVAGGVALGTGIAKANVDKEAEKLEAELARLRELALDQNVLALKPINIDWSAVAKTMNNGKSEEIAEKEKQLEQLTDKSKKLGNWRTGSMAVGTVANIAGAVIAGNNRVKGDLKSQIDECLISVKTLSNVRMQARVSGNASEADLARAENIVRACEEWSMVDISSINKKASGAAISSGVGAGLGLAGTVTSAMANTDSTRNDNSESGKSKEKNLNMASNILAGGTTVASGVATVFNATQIGAIKRAVTVADKCEEALK